MVNAELLMCPESLNGDIISPKFPLGRLSGLSSSLLSMGHGGKSAAFKKGAEDWT